MLPGPSIVARSMQQFSEKRKKEEMEGGRSREEGTTEKRGKKEKKKKDRTKCYHFSKKQEKMKTTCDVFP